MALNDSGQITVTTAGTPVQGPAQSGVDPFIVSFIAHPDNTGTTWFVNGSGETGSSDGYPISASIPVIKEAANMAEFWFDASANGDIICWTIIAR